MATKQATVTPKDIAEDLDVTPLQIRIFLRSRQMNVGRGKRYKFTTKQAEKLKTEYAKEHGIEME